MTRERRNHRKSFESLEQRRLMAITGQNVSWDPDNDLLKVDATGQPDNVYIKAVQVVNDWFPWVYDAKDDAEAKNESPVWQGDKHNPQVLASDVLTLEVYARGDNDYVSLLDVDENQFPNLDNIGVRGNDGNDTLIGSNTLPDSLWGDNGDGTAGAFSDSDLFHPQ